MIDRSRTPDSDICKVRGIGVAVRVRTCTSLRISFNRSLWVTPKRCSSSITSRPRFLKRTDLASKAWVPITMSTVPRDMPSRVRLASRALTKRDNWLTVIGNPRKRSANDLKCWRTKSVVGAITATCWPCIAATNAARMATSVLPNPTSPHTSRSIGWPEAISAKTSSIADSWSSVS